MKFLVVDDHVLIRQAMQGLLKKLRRDAVVLEASSTRQAMQIAAEQPDLDLILLDLNLPDGDGLSVLSELRDRLPKTGIVVLSALQDPDNIERALELGALGYIPKSADGEVMLNALRLVMSGGIYIPPEILARAQQLNPAPRAPGRRRAQHRHRDIVLTERQMAVLMLVMEGKSNKTICRILKLAMPTVKNHVTGILKALKVSTRAEAVAAVHRLGWDVTAALNQEPQ